MAVLGAPTDEQRRGYALTRDMHRMAIDRCRPGVLASDVYAAVADAFGKHGEKYTASMVGHGVGAWFHQQEPILSRTARSRSRRAWCSRSSPTAARGTSRT